MKTGPAPRPVMARFMEAIFPEPNSGCWLWDGSYTTTGYGHLTLGSRSDGTRRKIKAHRLAWLLFRSQIPPDIKVCHKCDTPPCANPDHLFLGSQGDNMADASAKGRLRKPDPARTHCRNGHPLTPADTACVDGLRRCRVCTRAATRRHYATHGRPDRGCAAPALRRL